MTRIDGVVSATRAARVRGPAVLCAALVATTLLAGTASAGAPNTWTPAAPLNTGRLVDASASLHNGDVLVAGGQDSSGNTTNSAEIYHPGTDTWVSAGVMSTPRFAPVAVTLQSGKVLVVGGTTDNTGSTALDTGEVYDPSTNTWTSVANTMSSPRGDYPAIALLPNGNVVIAGGADSSGNAVASADIYNPATNTFTPAAAMSTARILTAAIPLPSGKVLVVGGQDTTTLTPIDTAEIYNPGSNSWSPASNSMSVARTLPGVAPLPNGDVLVAGGVMSGSTLSTPSVTTASADIYDPSSNSFSAGPPMSVSRVLFGITSLADGRVLVAGGASIYNGGGFISGDSEIYDPRTNSWSEEAPLPPTAGLTLNLLPNGQALAAGGTANFNAGSTQAELYTPPTPPGAPVAVSATAGSHSAYVTFAPSANDGGFQALHYTITASSGQTVTTPDGRTFATVTGLTNGRKVTFTVTATNSLGPGPASSPSNAVTPMAPAHDKAPKLRVLGLAKRLSMTSFMEGVRFSVKPSKAASLQISLLASAKGATIARAGTLTLANMNMRRSANRCRVVLVPLKRLVGHPRTARVEVVIVAIDKAGSRSTTSRWITIWSPPPPARVVIPTGPVTITPRGDAPVPITCPLSARGGCTGTLTLRLARGGTTGDEAESARCARGCRPLGTAHFHIHAGVTGLVGVHLSASGLGLLAQHHTLLATATVTTVSGGHSATSIGTVTLTAPAGMNATTLGLRSRRSPRARAVLTEPKV